MASTPSPNASYTSSVKSAQDSVSPALPTQAAKPFSSAPDQPLLRPPEKISVKGRLMRIFGKDNTQHPSSTPDVTALANPDAPSKPQTASRKGPGTDKAAEWPIAPAAAKKNKPFNGIAVYQRFVVNTDVPGGHEHHLGSSGHQEKLSHMIRGLLGMKAEQASHDLSLMSSWLDNLKLGKKNPVVNTNGDANASTMLTEKYGKCQEVVGRGAFGIVRISRKKMHNGPGEKLFAVKEFRRRPGETEHRYSRRLTAEFCISSSLRHPSVIRTLDLLKDEKGDYCEVMEFCAGGDLHTLIVAAGKLGVQEADCFFKQMMRGVKYIHEMGVAHRDLKPENLLLTSHGGLRITDFGNSECFSMARENDAHMVSGLCGSGPYISPEEYVDKEFDARAVDVWACGIIYMAMRSGRHLWRVAKKDEDEFYARYLEDRRVEEGYGPIESLHRARCRNVIYSILDPNPTRRITASQVLKSEWGCEIRLCTAGEGYL